MVTHCCVIEKFVTWDDGGGLMLKDTVVIQEQIEEMGSCYFPLLMLSDLGFAGCLIR